MPRENCYKIAVIGASGSGKSKYIKELVQLSNHNKNRDVCKYKYTPTVGVSVNDFTILLMDKNITFKLIEIAGDDNLRGDVSNHLRDIDGAIVIIDERTTSQQYVGMINLLSSNGGNFPILNVFNRHSVALLPQEELKPLINVTIDVDSRASLTFPIKTLYGKIKGYIQ